jgi:Bacteriophage related domain of unknown function
MASKPVVDAVEAFIAAGWSRATEIPINTTGEPPADGSPWLTVQYPVAIERHIGMAQVGNRSFREEGVIRLVLAVKRAQGQGQGLAWLDELRALFRAAQFGGVTCFAPSPPINNDTNATGLYWVLSSSVPYYFDLFA